MADACAPQRAKPLVLCIEDNETQLALRKEILESDGFLVIDATNANEAIEILRETPVSVVVSDHMLSGATGTQLAGEIKKLKPDVPVLLYSGRSPDRLDNIDCFVNKTEPAPTFLAIVREFVDRYWA